MNVRLTPPAAVWRAFFILGCATVVALAGPQPNQTAPDFSSGETPSPAEAVKILEQLRRVGVTGEYFLEFELHALPRRGEERVYRGKLWGSRNDRGPVTRIAVNDAAGVERRFLLQNGRTPSVWSWSAGRHELLGVNALFTPLVPDTELTSFDLQMPYLFWREATLERLTRLRGRPTHVFRFGPPAEFAAQHPQLAAVRAYFDAQFNALVQSELIGPDGRVLKTLALLDLKKIGDQPVPKDVDFRDETTRNKTRFTVTGAALGLDLLPALFEPANLGDTVTPPPAARLTRIDP